MCTILAPLYHRPREKSNACSIRRGPARRRGPQPRLSGTRLSPRGPRPAFRLCLSAGQGPVPPFPGGAGPCSFVPLFFPQRPLFLWKNSRKNRGSPGWGPVALHRMGTVLVKTGPRRRIVAASCASLASPFGDLSSAPLRLLSHPHPLRWAADGSPVPPFPTPIPLKRPSTGGWGPKWSPAKRVHLGEEEQGSGPIFRRQAEMEGSGLCDDELRRGPLLFSGSRAPIP